jgi:flavin-binding protein dodecin
MNDNIYKQIKLTGTSSKNIEDAVERALAKAAKTVRNMRWFQVIETRGHITDGKVAQWQIVLEVGFTLDD